MNKSVIFSLFLMASLVVGTSLNMNMFSTAMADGKDRDDKRYHYDNDNRYEQSKYEQDSYSNSYDMGYGYDNLYDSNYETTYDRSHDVSYDKNWYKIDNSYSKYPTDDKPYECRTGPFEGFFVSSVEFCKFKFDKDDRDRDNKTCTKVTSQVHQEFRVYKAQLVTSFSRRK